MAQRAGGRGTTSDASVPELMSQVTTDISELMRKELELAQIEVKEQISRAAKAGAMFGAMGVVAFLALLLLSFAAAWGLAEVLATGLAFLVAGIVFLAIAGILFLQGRKWMARFSPVPEETVETVKEDVQWARAQLK